MFLHDVVEEKGFWYDPRVCLTSTSDVIAGDDSERSRRPAEAFEDHSGEEEEDTCGEDGEDDDADEGTEEEEVEVEDHDQEFCGVAGARPAKMRKLTWRVCLCCTVRVVPRGEPLKKFAEKSWATLHKAAEVRGDASYFFLNDQGTSLGEGSLSEPKGLHHKQCDSSYKSIRNLDVILKNRLDSTRPACSEDMRGNGNQQSTTHEEVKPTQMRVLRRNLSGTYYTKCVFC